MPSTKIKSTMDVVTSIGERRPAKIILTAEIANRVRKAWKNDGCPQRSDYRRVEEMFERMIRRREDWIAEEDGGAYFWNQVKGTILWRKGVEYTDVRSVAFVVIYYHVQPSTVNDFEKRPMFPDFQDAVEMVEKVNRFIDFVGEPNILNVPTGDGRDYTHLYAPKGTILDASDSGEQPGASSGDYSPGSGPEPPKKRLEGVKAWLSFSKQPKKKPPKRVTSDDGGIFSMDSM